MCGAGFASPPRRSRRADVTEDGSRDHLHARAQRVQIDLVGAFAEDANGRAAACCGASGRAEVGRLRGDRGGVSSASGRAQREARDGGAFGERRARLRAGGRRTARSRFGRAAGLRDPALTAV